MKTLVYFLFFSLFFSGLSWGFTLEKLSNGNPVRWFKKEIPYKISQNIQAKYGEKGVAGIDKAFQVWQTALKGKVTFINKGIDTAKTKSFIKETLENNITLVYIEENWTDPAVLALTFKTTNAESGEIWDADIAINPAFAIELFEDNHQKKANDPDQWDLVSILTHEIGHLLGLKHSEDTSAVMYASQKPHGLEKRTLFSDDINGVLELYEKIPFPEVKKTPTVTPTTTPSDVKTGFGCQTSTKTVPFWFLFLLIPFACFLLWREKSSKKES